MTLGACCARPQPTPLCSWFLTSSRCPLTRTPVPHPPGCSQVYVQDLIQANGAQLYPLFEAGAVVYVCGDARRMVRLPVLFAL